MPERGTLYVVATPIGNLGDLSPRARDVLENAGVVFCEDTRHTRALFSALGLGAAGRLERLDAHASPGKVEAAVTRLIEGASAAVVSDAGTPGVSDPAAALVASARKRGVRVAAVAGPSAVTALVSVSGMAATEFSFYGFFPRKESGRDEALKALGGERLHVWFESPHRIADALAAVARAVPDARVLAAKELTKLHEKVWSGEAPDVAREVTHEIEKEGPRGEWCFAVRLTRVGSGEKIPDGDGSETPCWHRALECLLDAGVSTSRAAKTVSQHFGVARNDAYEAALERKNEK